MALWKKTNKKTPKKQTGNSIVGFIKKRKLWFGPSNNPDLLEALKFSLVANEYALSHWSNDKMIASMNTGGKN